MQVGFIISLFFAIVVAVFALKNGGRVNIDFIFAEIEVSQAIVIFVSAALGAIIVAVLGLVRQVKLSMKIKEQNKIINSLENYKETLEKQINEFEETKIEANLESLNEAKEASTGQDNINNTKEEK